MWSSICELLQGLRLVKLFKIKYKKRDLAQLTRCSSRRARNGRLKAFSSQNTRNFISPKLDQTLKQMHLRPHSCQNRCAFNFLGATLMLLRPKIAEGMLHSDSAYLSKAAVDLLIPHEDKLISYQRGLRVHDPL